MLPEDLYRRPDIYNQLFPLDEQEVSFWQSFLPKQRLSNEPNLIVDLGAGSSNLADQLSENFGIKTLAVDICRPLLRANSMLNRVQACASQLPLRTASATLLISRLFPIAYAAAEKPSAKLPQLAREIRRVLHPAGEVAIEIPLSHTPRRLQGISETTEIAPNLIYEFQYLELMCEHELGAVLDTQITVTSSPVTFRLSAPLFVFTPAGALRWACEARLINARFYSSYDLTESTITPPPDALRGILAGTHA